MRRGYFICITTISGRTHILHIHKKMKELYLIPKQGYERMISSLSIRNTNAKANTKIENKNKWKTTLPPPSLQNSSPPAVPLRVIRTPENISDNKNPSLNEILPVTFKGDDISRAKLLLKHFEKTGNITWDSNGDLFTPFNKGNIIDIINVFNSGRTKFTKAQILLYRYIVSATSLPLWMIKNSEIKKLISSKDIVNPVKKRKGAGCMKDFSVTKYKKINKIINNKNWKSY